MLNASYYSQIMLSIFSSGLFALCIQMPLNFGFPHTLYNSYVLLLSLYMYYVCCIILSRIGGGCENQSRA